MDDKDKFILKELEKDSRISLSKIAKEIDVTEGSVRNRIKRLFSKSILEKFTVDYKGKYTAVLCIESNGDISEILASQDIKFFKTAGRYNYICLISDDPEKTLNNLSLNKEISHVDLLMILD